jgi:hypothetical protein
MLTVSAKTSQFAQVRVPESGCACRRVEVHALRYQLVMGLIDVFQLEGERHTAGGDVAGGRLELHRGRALPAREP